ncbi:AAA family ATPase [Parafrankia sp. FMc2]|uniref:bifunctional aminoglycoside phosphotransferase/ATP-binding protein n=1 Tax=Parafrankia sp. FMc2 TaxID=3233196 RepID=UPI0034D3F757
MRMATTGITVPAGTGPGLGAMPGLPAALSETLTSVLVFLGDRVYKIKKTADLGFLDFRTREARLAACQAEVNLNRRLAPDVYLGVADIQGPDGALLDHMVVMRRLPADRRLSSLLAAGSDVTGPLRAVARLLADFHARCATSERITEAGSPANLRWLWAEVLDSIEPFLGPVLDTNTIDAIRHLAHRYLDGRGPLLHERQRDGRIRDGHGDLLADDIYCLDDGPRILDCLEYDQRMRVGDVLSDIAFLAMDLERLGRPDLSRFLLDQYRAYTAVTHPLSLENLYIAYRAFTMCRIACTQYAQGWAAAAAEARALASLALASLRRGRTRLVLVGGGPETGRSAVAGRLAESEGWTLLRASSVERELGHLPRGDGHPDGHPDGRVDGRLDGRADVAGAVRDELLRRARTAVERGETVVIDASWTRRQDRQEAAALARATFTDLVQLRCAPPGPAAGSLVRAESDAGSPVAWSTPTGPEHPFHTDPWPEAKTLEHGPTPTDIHRAARRAAR